MDGIHMSSRLGRVEQELRGNIWRGKGKIFGPIWNLEKSLQEMLDAITPKNFLYNSALFCSLLIPSELSTIIYPTPTFAVNKTLYGTHPEKI